MLPSSILLTIASLGGALFSIYWGLRVVGALVSGFWKLQAQRLDKTTKGDLNTSFTPTQISDSISEFIEPDCSQVDPSNEDDLRFIAAVKEPITASLDRFVIPNDNNRHILILADSGMGKTTICLNYARHIKKKNSNLSVALYALSRSNVNSKISEISNKSSTILILDALDEDTQAIRDYRSRIINLLDAAADFHAVIVTCRSQFFSNDASIPTDTGVSIIGPRAAGEGGTHKIYRIYLNPFTNSQITKFIERKFSIFNPINFLRRREAFSLVKSIPELSVRPMLLSILPDMVRDKFKSKELFDLYHFMIEKWLDRESKWIEKDHLLAISKNMAVNIYSNLMISGSDRISPLQAEKIFSDNRINADLDWNMFKARSLINRDSSGNIKFAHRSILEYLFVMSAIDGNDDCFELEWTDLMREMLVSWGHARHTNSDIERAEHILKLNLKRARLIPLSRPRELPEFVTKGEFAKLARHGGVATGRKRSISKFWRPKTVEIKLESDVYVLLDYEYNLFWKFPDFEALITRADLPLFRSSLAETKSVMFEKGGERLPSYDEILSFIEALEVISSKSVLLENEFYWLGDSAGKQKYFVFSLGDNPMNAPGANLVDGPREVLDTGRKISVYVIAQSHNSGRISDFRAISLTVSPLADTLL